MRKGWQHNIAKVVNSFEASEIVDLKPVVKAVIAQVEEDHADMEWERHRQDTETTLGASDGTRRE
jgi:hypothetical protein